ncbi:polyketide synthase, putative [Talaromyces stipitatus ATCC 10500]|uniref:Polyketide synthase, putative n=1 Tax=Talaromyces stipitatus (strain ATCC 10500 / CBS 375.48 / QM 6759 / NRRL 1006) TaxID=441959 RepID=B8MEK8_TALSN|nr:polyketide synthase, putative [Talaromyces stipitatus ATCC 10500]EED16635.1 polyketide synthase, putative [Talaromyces stipitatus ATCC 10500]
MHSATASEPIAIIGMSSRFAGDATDTEKLWDVLLKGRPSPSPFLNDKHYHPDQSRQGAIHAKAAYFIKDDTKAFDSAFFGLTKKEVLSMDPQQRMLLESTYHALENSGIPLEQAIGTNTSVFVGQCGEDFAAMCNSDMELAPTYKETGVERSIRANRISWFYDFKGASYVVDTACSSSLVALYTGCQDLLLHDSEMAVVSGITLIDHPSQFMGLDKLGAIGSDGYCYTFDSRANGYARGEGVGTILLKRLSDAIRDGNIIRAVIRSSSASSNGRTPGIFNPSFEAQTALIRSTYNKAGLDPGRTRFVEAHGTGTKAGDATEAKALSTAFETAKRNAPLIVGAVKTILGHTEGAAGILSVIKVVKMLETGIIPKNHNFVKVNPEIDAEKLNIRFPIQTMKWPSKGIRRASINSFGFGGANAHAVIDDTLSYITEHNLHAIHQTVALEETQKMDDENSLVQIANGLNGHMVAQHNGHAVAQTNGHSENQTKDHMVTQSNGHAELQINIRSDNCPNGASSEKKSSNFEVNDAIRKRLFVFSTFDKKGLSRTAETYREWLQISLPQRSQNPDYVRRLAFTLSHHRSKFNWRSYVAAGNLEELLDKMASLTTLIAKSQTPNLALIFTGQGAQWDGMIGALSQFTVYRRSIEDAAAYFTELGCPWDLTELLDHRVTLDRDDLALNLPLVTVLQVAIVDLLYSWDIKPRCVVGHSSGEVAAAYASGKIGRKAAWKTAYFRGIVAAKISGQDGGMLAVALSPERAKEYIRDYENAGKLTIACYNSPSNQTLSGDVDAIDALKAILDEEKIFARKLNVSNAYHSSHMVAGAEEYTRLLGNLHTDGKLTGWSDVEMISSVTGSSVSSKQLEMPSYWTENLVSPVQFTSALLKMCNESGIAFDDLIEIGPHSAMQSAVNETLQNTLSAGSLYHATVKRKTPSAGPIIETAGALWCRGHHICLDEVNEIEPKTTRMLSDLPPYKFSHESNFLLESRLSSNYRYRQFPRMDLIGAPVPDWDSEHPKWRQFFRTKEIPWIMEHKITGQIVCAGAGWVVMAIEGAKQLADPALKVTGFRLRDVALKSTLIVPETDDGVEVTMSMQWMPDSSETVSKIWREFTIMSHDEESNTWRVHAKGLISIEYEQSTKSIDKDNKMQAEDAAARRLLARVTENCKIDVDSDWVYGMFRAAGFDFKARYKNLSDISISEGPDCYDVLGVVRNPDLTSVTAAGYVYPHTYHTVALDSVIHMGLPTILAKLGNGTVPSPTIPGWFDEVWISANISSRAGDALKLCMHQYKDFWHGLRNDIVGFDEHNSERQLHIKGLKYHTVPGRQLSSTLEPCHQITWKPVLDLKNTDDLTLTKMATKLLVVKLPETKQSEFCQLLAKLFTKEAGTENCEITPLEQIKEFDLSDLTCIVLSDGETASLIETDEKTFDHLKYIVTVSPRIFWVSSDSSRPQWAIASGFLRTARWEKGGSDTDFSILNIVRSGNDELDSTHAQRVFNYHFSDGRAIPNADYELRSGTIWSNRISEFDEVNEFRRKHTFPGSQIILGPFRSNTKRSLRLKAQTPGRLETLHFVDDVDATKPLAADEVEVKVAAAGLNFRDVVVGLGEQTEDVYGIEGAGWITEVGSDVTGIKVGDRVAGVWSRERGYMRSSCKVHHALATKIPDDMSFEAAAAIPMNLITAIYSLRELAHLTSGEKVLIHSGAGGTGQAAIQYAQMVGAEVFTTVSTEEKRQHIVENYGISADHIFSSRTLDFDTLIMEATNGRGVDVVLNSLAGEALRRSLDCVAPLGRFVELGKKDIYANGRLHMKALKKSIAFFSVDILTLFKHRESYSGELLAEAIDMLYKGTIRLPPVLEVYSFSDILPAFRKLQTGNMMGKIVLTASDNDMVPTAMEAPKPFSFRGDVSYIISGGLRGVGKVIAQWMVSHGARNLILLSRSGVHLPETKAFVERLRLGGCRVVSDACDIASENDLRRLLESCKDMPQINGCIQSAMVLRDKSILNMNHEDWIAAIRPKVNGSWNLHNLLPRDLDFFVMLSSITGVVGNHGQANYAAGNTFQDELARYRVSQGLRATSLDLSAISGVGWIAEHSNIDTLLRGAAFQQLKEEDIFTVLQYACDPENTATSVSGTVGEKENDDSRRVKMDQSEIIVGMDNAAAIRRKAMAKPAYLDHALFSSILEEYNAIGDTNTGDGEGVRSLANSLSACSSIAFATELIIEAIKQKLADLISTPAEDIDDRKTFSSYGVDSLVAVEFRSWLGAEVASDIAVLEIIGSRSIRTIATKVATTSSLVNVQEAMES